MTDALAALFGTQGHGTALQASARAVLVFVYGYAAIRILGPRIFGRWSAPDIILSLIIGSNLSRALTGNAPLWDTLAATSVLLALHWALAHLAARHPKLSHLIEGRPIDLVRDGELRRKSLLRWSISVADIGEALRQKGETDVRKIGAALLEPSGTISILTAGEAKTGGEIGGATAN